MISLTSICGSAQAILVCLLLSVVPAAAQQPNIDFNVSGTSTVRGWTCAAKGLAVVTPGGTPAPGFPKGVQTATLTVR